VVIKRWLRPSLIHEMSGFLILGIPYVLGLILTILFGVDCFCKFLIDTFHYTVNFDTIVIVAAAGTHFFLFSICEIATVFPCG